MTSCHCGPLSLFLQASESGVHRPHVAGIHGRESEGAYSIVLSGGYEDDEDEGEEFTYSGSGGRDLSGNKRTAKQSYDQKLTHMNRYVCSGEQLHTEIERAGDIGNDIFAGLWQGTAMLRLTTRKELQASSGGRGSRCAW